MRPLFLLLFVLSLTSCGSCGEDGSAQNNGTPDAGIRTEPDVTPSPCFGCFDETDTCVSGDRDEACGEGGTRCKACEEGTGCGDDGQCLVPPACTPDNCDGCCNAMDECVGGEGVDACGADGLGCAECPEGASCVAGRCELGCGPDNCDGCCDASGSCVSGTDDVLCGDGGGACADCTVDSGVCGGNACVATGCAQSCAGCCTGDQCVDGTNAQQCGVGGASCNVCADSQTCSAGACQSTPDGTWDVVLLSADIAPTKPSGSGWDSVSPLPEVFAEMYSADPASAMEWYDTSSVVSETLTPVWNETVLVGVTTEALVRGVEFLFWDQDDFFDDEVCYGLIEVDASMMNSMIVETTCDADARTRWRWRIDPH